MALILVLDTETTGLPEKMTFHHYYDYKFSRYYSGSRVIELGCVLYDMEGSVVDRGSWLIGHPDSPGIPDKITELTGITAGMVRDQGVAMDAVAPAFHQLLGRASKIVMHNAGFDRHVLAAEFHRYKYEALAKELFDKPFACTMEAGKAYTAIRTATGFIKYPKLAELYLHFFKEPIEGGHRATNDVLATARCYFAMQGVGKK